VLPSSLAEEASATIVELRTDIAGLRVEFRTELQQVRTELLRWMFGFWVTTLLGIAGLLIALGGH
jgi:hypothetical protein